MLSITWLDRVPVFLCISNPQRDFMQKKKFIGRSVWDDQLSTRGTMFKLSFFVLLLTGNVADDFGCRAHEGTWIEDMSIIILDICITY